MPDIHHPMDCYHSLLSAAGAVLDADRSLHKNSVAVSDFVGLVAGKEPEIAEFRKVWTELLAWMDRYDFNEGYDFGGMKDKIESLCVLREKLVKLKEEAGKLTGLPDRYGLKDALDTARNLDRRCKEEMGLNEIPSCLDDVLARTDDLSSLQKRFQGDDFQLDRIRQILEEQQELLAKYRAFQAEIREYQEAFPHVGADDFSVVENRLLSLEETDADVDYAADKVDGIRGFCDRHGQKKIVTDFETLVKEMQERMLFGDISKYRVCLNGICTRAEAAKNGFEKDKRELAQMAEELYQNRPDMWAEDNRKLLEFADSLIKKDYREASFGFVQLKEGMRNAKLARKTDIEKDLERYGWLSRGNYHKRFETLVSRFITEGEYQKGVEVIKGDHAKKVWKIGGISAVVIALVAVTAAGYGGILLLPIIAVVVWLYSKIKNKVKE